MSCDVWLCEGFGIVGFWNGIRTDHNSTTDAATNHNRGEASTSCTPAYDSASRTLLVFTLDDPLVLFR